VFDGCQQWAIYQFMSNGPDALCLGCTHLTNKVIDLAPLADEGVSWRTVSKPAPCSDGVLLGWQGLD